MRILALNRKKPRCYIKSLGNYRKGTLMQIRNSGSQPSVKGPAEYFTGTVRIDAPFAGEEPARIGGATVTFEPGARTAWQGFLTGKVDPKTGFDKSDLRSWFPRFTPEAMQANQALVELLNRIAGQKHASAAQIALAWLLAKKPWIVPIPGTRKLQRLEEDLASANVVLTADDMREIETAAAMIKVQGARGTGNEKHA
jgi:Aldo/keto reductase family